MLWQVSREPAANLEGLPGQDLEELLLLRHVSHGQVMVLRALTRKGQTWGRNNISIPPRVEGEEKSDLLAGGEPRRWPEPRTGELGKGSPASLPKSLASACE